MPKINARTMKLRVGIDDQYDPKTKPQMESDTVPLMNPKHSNGSRRLNAGQHSSSHMSGGRSGR